MRKALSLATASVVAIAITAIELGAMAQSAKADINIQINTGSSSRHRPYHRHPHHYDDVPVVRTILPDGRIIERYGYPRGRREVIMLPSAGVIQQPIYAPPIIQQPIIQQPVQIQQQTQQPRLLHGQDVSPFTAVVVGSGHLSGREGPGSVYSALTRFAPGQTVTVTRRAGGGDGYDWFLAASTAGQYAWIRGDCLAIYTFD